MKLIPVLASLLLLPVFHLFAVTLSEVRIENLDNIRMDESFVRAYTSLRAGQEVESEAELNAAVARDVDNLRRSKRFSFVRAYVEQDGENFRLVYSVSSRLRLRRIDIEGADGIGNRKISKELGLALGDYVDEALVGEKARKVEVYCRKNKYPDASVAWKLIPDEAAGTADLKVTVNEGPKFRVKRIRFEGKRFLDNSRLSRTGRFFKQLLPFGSKAVDRFDERQVRGLLKQKKTWWITSWFGAYHPELVETDLAAIRKFYQDRGFLDVKVDAPAVQELGRGKLGLTYTVTEGVQYRIGTISLDGATLFSPAELEKQIRLKSGDLAAQSAIDAASDSVNHYYGNRGYIRNYVQPVIATHPETGIADVRFVVHEGALARIHEIDIRGNEKTRDEVMRRELAVYPGELFHQQRVETSENRLRNLGYFETVSSSYIPASETNTYDLTFNVKEKSMGSFIIGAGFSSVDSLVGFAEVSHGNFDIKRWPPVGDGQKMKVRVQAGTERNDAEISFVEPWFLDRKLAFGVDLYHRDAGYYSDDYSLKTIGAKVSLTKPLSPFVRGTVSYSLEQFDVYDIDAPVGPPPAEIWSEEGARTKSTVGFSVSRDTRDQFFIPTRGNYSSAGVEFAGGPLAGDTDIYMLEAKTSQFWSLLNGHVFNLKGSISTVESHGDGNVPIFDRLFLGGPRTIRSFAYRDVSPRDPNNGNEPLGGLSSWYVTAEYTVPLWTKIRGAVFYDIGEVSEDSFNFTGSDLNSGYGIGARFDLPMFPLRLDYAFPHLTDDYNEEAGPRWNFLLGYTF
ncbi:MAG: outer membrane protein assembly factor BamA [Kiritimatiellales bacterium]